MLDLDDDGRLDVFATLFADSREGQVWAFFQPADPIAEPWPALAIDPGPLFGVHSQGAGSFDGTTRPQVMVGETNIGGFGFGPNPSPEIYVYRRIGDARVVAGWERVLVDTQGTHEAQVVDLDGDGLADIAGDEENTELGHHPRDGIVSWWQNRTVLPGEPPPPCTNPAGCPPPPTLPPPTLPPPTLPPPSAPSCDDPRRCPAFVDCGDIVRHALVAAACFCREAGSSACGNTALAPRIERRRVRACAALDRAAMTERARMMARRARAAERLLGRLLRIVATGPGAVGPACAAGVVEGLEDARRRAVELAVPHAH